MARNLNPLSGRRRRLLTFFFVAVVIVSTVGVVHFVAQSALTRTLFTTTLSAFVLVGIFGVARELLLEDGQTGPRIIERASVRLQKPRTVLGVGLWSADVDGPAFFRAPPAWIDFQRDYVVEHPRLEAIYEAIERRKSGLLVVEGDPASGKSFLLHNLAFRLLDEQGLLGRHVFVLSLKRLDAEKVDELDDDFERVPSNSVVFVDDVHLEYLELSRIAESLSQRNVVLVFATRPLQNYPNHQVRQLESRAAERFEIDAESVADPLITRYLDEAALTEEERAAARDECWEYRHDLWMLESALMAYTDEGRATEESILHWIVENVFDAQRFEDPVVDPAEFLVPVACLYRFEIPVTRSFLLSTLGLPEEKLQALVETGDVLKSSGGRYRLHHSSIAQLILEAATRWHPRSFPDQVTESTEREGLSNPDAVVEAYVEAEPSRAVETLAGLAKTLEAGQELAATLIRRIDPEVLAEGLDPATNSMEDIGSFFSLFVRLDTRPDPVLTDELPAFVEASDSRNVAAWGWATDVLARLDLDVASLFGDRVAALLGEEAPELIANVTNIIWYADEELARRIAAKLDPDAIEARLRRGDYDRDVLAMTIAKLVWVHPGQFDPLAEWFGETLLGVEPTEFPRLLCRIAFGNPASARLLLDSLDRAAVGEYLSGVADDEQLFRAVVAMYVVSPEFVGELAAHVDLRGDDAGPDRYRSAVAELLAGREGPPIDAIQTLTSGPAHRGDTPESASVAAELRDLADENGGRLHRGLDSVADRYDPGTCLEGLLLLADETVRPMETSVLSEWVERLAASDEVPDGVGVAVRELVPSGAEGG